LTRDDEDAPILPSDANPGNESAGTDVELFVQVARAQQPSVFVLGIAFALHTPAIRRLMGASDEAMPSKACMITISAVAVYHPAAVRTAIATNGLPRAGWRIPRTVELGGCLSI